MAETEQSVATVKEWQKKSSDFFSNSNDSLLSLIAKGFETMSVSLSDDSDRKHVQCALLNLESQRMITMQFEDNESDILRSLAYGLIESLHLTLQKLHKKIDALQSHKQSMSPALLIKTKKAVGKIVNHNQFSESENSNSATPKSASSIETIPKEEKTEEATVIRRNNEASTLSPIADSDVKEEPLDEFEQILDPNAGPTLFSDDIVKQEEMFDESLMNGMEDTNESYEFGFDEDGYYDEEDEEEEEGEGTYGIDAGRLRPKMAGDPNNRKRPSRSVGVPKRYEERYEVPGPSVKKRRQVTYVTRSTPLSNQGMRNEGEEGECEEGDETMNDSTQSAHNPQNVYRKKKLVNSGKNYKPSTMELNCPVPECTFFSRYPKTWLTHLRKKHRTTPLLANVALKCVCGIVSLSCAHANVCEIAHFSVIKTQEGPIRRKTNSEWDTPMCMLTRNNKPCDKRPSTLTSFTAHVHRDHNSSLIKEGYYLQCECGEELNTQTTAHKHVQMCSLRNFTLHKLYEGTPQQAKLNAVNVWPAPSS